MRNGFILAVDALQFIVFCFCYSSAVLASSDSRLSVGANDAHLEIALIGVKANYPQVVDSASYLLDENSNDANSCLNSAAPNMATKSFEYEGRCKAWESDEGCYYYDYRKLTLPDQSGFDQRGVQSFQISFPQLQHRWAALAIDNPRNHEFCWLGGAHVGRNPLAMTWSGGKLSSGTKNRKNNFLLSEGGRIKVEGARLHNIHDAFLADSPEAGFEITRSWVSWNRDDFFEGYLHDLTITNSLIDGTYTFISDPDGECDQDKVASDKVITIRDSLIRLQRQPGPYAKHTEKWHWKILGGHHTLWKLDSCGWTDWPKFNLINNIFYLEGPSSSNNSLTKGKCNLALPGDCDDAALSNLVECENNLFLYEDYKFWTKYKRTPGPTPQPGNNYHNSANPDYLPNGKDCYQRITDDVNDPGYGAVKEIWNNYRLQWINKYSDRSDEYSTVMQIPGVDYPGFESGVAVSIRNRLSNLCIETSIKSEVFLNTCSQSKGQVFTVDEFSDGKLLGAILIKDSRGRYLRSQDPIILETSNDDSQFDTRIFAEDDVKNKPNFAERWYILPQEHEPGGHKNSYVIESDGIRRSYLRATDDQLRIMPFYNSGELTPVPQAFTLQGNDMTMQWFIEPIMPASSAIE